MKMETGTVKFFNNNPGKLFGFLLTLQGEVFFHFNNGCGVRPPVRGFDKPFLVSDDNRNLPMPKKGDRLVFERGVGKKGPKADSWAFEEDYKRAQLKPGIPSTDVNAPAHDGFSWNELEAVAGGIFGLMQCIPAASKQLNLTNEQIGIFLRNTPDGKKGEELWKEFRRRQADKGGDEYTFITFMREVLSEAGHPVTFTRPKPDFDPDNDQWGPPIAHSMSHEYD